MHFFLLEKRQAEEEVGSEQKWTLPANLGQLKTGKGGKGWLRSHLWCPGDFARFWDRLEIGSRFY